MDPKDDIEWWKANYRQALTTMFAYGEVVSRLRDECDHHLPAGYIDALIQEATDKWIAKMDELAQRS